MKYVLDVSAALCWVLPRPLTSKAVHLRDEYRQQVHELIAPAHFPGEVASALTKAERQNLIPVGDARRLIADVLNTAPALHAIDPLLYRAVDLSSQMRSAFYDCLYVALAEREGCGAGHGGPTAHQQPRRPLPVHQGPGVHAVGRP